MKPISIGTTQIALQREKETTYSKARLETSTMNRVYEIFEVLPSGSPQRVSVVPGLEFAKVVLEGLAMRTTNECFAADAKTHQVVMLMNTHLTVNSDS